MCLNFVGNDDTETYLHGDMVTANELESNPIETLLIALRAVNNARGATALNLRLHKIN